MKQTKKTQSLITVTATVALLAGMSYDANAGLEPFVGEISYVGFNFAPNGWAQCNGQLLPISQYSALFHCWVLHTAAMGKRTSHYPICAAR